MGLEPFAKGVGQLPDVYAKLELAIAQAVGKRSLSDDTHIRIKDHDVKGPVFVAKKNGQADN